MQDSEKTDSQATTAEERAEQRLLRQVSAVAREKELSGGTNDPISRWVLGGAAFSMLLAGVVLASIRSPFGYEQFVKPDYHRGSSVGDDDQGLPPVDALKGYMTKGEKIYSKCGACHGPDGKGGPAYPSLAGSEWAQGETERFAMIILNGLTGPAEDGKTYGIMPSQAAGMSAMDLASVMTYVRNSFGNKTGDIVTIEMAEEAFKISKERKNAGEPVTADELTADHVKSLPGDALDTGVMVDPITLKPADG